MQKRNRTPQKRSLEERLAEHATRLREEAKALPSGGARDAVLRRAEQAATFADNDELLRRPNLAIRA
jgi:hypothetical protein